MRKIQAELLTAIMLKRPFSKQNTVFARIPDTDKGWQVLLHGNPIATFDAGDRRYPIPTYISLAGYQTKTTCSRLNALPGVEVRVKGGVPYLNGREIEADGWWSPRSLCAFGY